MTSADERKHKSFEWATLLPNRMSPSARSPPLALILQRIDFGLYPSSNSTLCPRHRQTFHSFDGDATEDLSTLGREFFIQASANSTATDSEASAGSDAEHLAPSNPARLTVPVLPTANHRYRISLRSKIN